MACLPSLPLSYCSSVQHQRDSWALPRQMRRHHVDLPRLQSPVTALHQVKWAGWKIHRPAYCFASVSVPPSPDPSTNGEGTPIHHPIYCVRLQLKCQLLSANPPFTHTSAFSIRRFYPPFTRWYIRTSADPLFTRGLYTPKNDNLLCM